MVTSASPKSSSDDNSWRPGRELRIGILGAGMIATAPSGFLPGLRKIADRVSVVAITSRTRSRAEHVAASWNIPDVYDSLSAMLANADIDAVLNLTPISAHYETSREILSNGKHLVTEKPLASTTEEADDLCAIAERSGLLIVCAPADMLSHDWSQARELVRSGAVGKVAFARVHSSHAGPAWLSWPTDPSWFYQKGSGPLLDLGPYGLTQITGILGPVQRVTAMSGITVPIRHARGGPYDGMEIPVTEDDNSILLLDFGDATFATLDATFNVVATRSAPIEIYGHEGTLLVRPPHLAASPGQPALELYRTDADGGLPGWVVPQVHDPRTSQDRTQYLQRAVLVEHLLDCLESGAEPVASAAHARHVLDVMLAAKRASRDGRTVEVATTF